MEFIPYKKLCISPVVEACRRFAEGPRVCLRKGCGRGLLDSCTLNNTKQILVDTFKCKVAETVRTKK